jgi:hypothetical protein
MKKIIVLVSTAACMLSYFAYAQETATNTTAEIAPQNNEQELIVNLLHDTIEKQTANIERYREITNDIERAQDKKRYNLLFIGYIIPVNIPGLLLEQMNIREESGSFVESFDIDYNYVSRRLDRYNESKQKFAEKPTKLRGKQADRKYERYLLSLSEFFLDDPASALYFIENNYNYDKQEVESIFLEMRNAALNPYSVDILLSNFNKVISAPEDIFTVNALKKLTSLDTEKFYAKLAEYADIKLNKKPILDKFFKRNQSKAEKVFLKEQKKMASSLSLTADEGLNK